MYALVFNLPGLFISALHVAGKTLFSVHMFYVAIDTTILALSSLINGTIKVLVNQ
jgi:hypothetical protein